MKLLQITRFYLSDQDAAKLTRKFPDSAVLVSVRSVTPGADIVSDRAFAVLCFQDKEHDDLPGMACIVYEVAAKGGEFTELFRGCIRSVLSPYVDDEAFDFSCYVGVLENYIRITGLVCETLWFSAKAPAPAPAAAPA